MSKMSTLVLDIESRLMNGETPEDISIATGWSVAFIEEFLDCLKGSFDEYAEYDESMDGDFDSAMASAGYGTDEDYGYYGDDV